MEFEVPDMTCGGCANAIRRALTQLDPAAQLEVDVPVKIVKVTSTQSSQRIVAAIEAAGFHPTPRA